jgi:hypothetical protein
LGLSYTGAAREEFLVSGVGTPQELQDLEQQYGMRLRADLSLAQIDLAAARLQAAFQGDPLRRNLSMADARIAAGAFLKSEGLATGDLQLFKRCRDLGLNAEFIGSARALARAIAYIPQLITIARS